MYISSFEVRPFEVHCFLSSSGEKQIISLKGILLRAIRFGLCWHFDSVELAWHSLLSEAEEKKAKEEKSCFLLKMGWKCALFNL